MKTVPLYGRKAAGRVALVDDADYELVMRYRWHVQEKLRTGQRSCPYASTRPVGADGRQHNLFMHTLITGYAKTDHINHDGLDNQRANLRPATNAQNAYNQRPEIGTSSYFRGVTWHRRMGKWQAQIGINGRHRYLGVFACEEDAADAYDSAALEAFGEYAYLNRAERRAS